MSELLAGFLGVLIGAFLGHRFSLDRDKRKEYNQAVTPFLEYMYKIEEQANNGHIWSKINEPDLLKVKMALSRRNLKKFEMLMNSYYESLKKAYPINEEKPWEGASAITSEFNKIIVIIRKIRNLLKPH